MASNWRQRQKEELRQLLYNTALQLFESQGYEGTTVQTITDAVQVAKGTFFNHFPSKEHVVEEWYNRLTVDSLAAARLQVAEGGAGNAEESVCALFQDMVCRAVAQPELLVAKARNNSNPLLMQAEQAQDDEMKNFVRERCRVGKEQGELDAELDTAFFADLLTAVATGSSRAWVRSEPRFDFTKVIVERVRFLFRGARVSQQASVTSHDATSQSPEDGR